MGMSAAHCQGNVREFQSVWRVVTLSIPDMRDGFLPVWREVLNFKFNCSVTIDFHLYLTGQFVT